MATQSIGLSTTATTATKFNGSDVTKINLNGNEIWTEPASSPAYPTYTTSGASNSTSYSPYIEMFGEDGVSYLMNTSTLELYNRDSPNGTSITYWYLSCGYFCLWVNVTGAYRGAKVAYAGSPQYLNMNIGASASLYTYKRSN